MNLNVIELNVCNTMITLIKNCVLYFKIMALFWLYYIPI